MSPLRCPICGLLNPSEASRCDCGYRFKREPSTDSPGALVDQHLTHRERGFVERRRSAATTLTWFGAFFITVSLLAAIVSFVTHVPIVLWIGGFLLGGAFLSKASKLRPPR